MVEQTPIIRLVDREIADNIVSKFLDGKSHMHQVTLAYADGNIYVTTLSANYVETIYKVISK